MISQTEHSKFRFACSMLAIPLLTLVSFAGCNGGHPTKRVAGRVTFEGEAPPKAGEIFFAPLEPAAGMQNRPAGGTFDKSGSFTLRTFEDGDGVLPGKYQVNIECWRIPPTLENRLDANYVPQSFWKEVVVAKDDKEPVVIEIDVPEIQK